jgi:hypothetical protein
MHTSLPTPRERWSPPLGSFSIKARHLPSIGSRVFLLTYSSMSKMVGEGDDSISESPSSRVLPAGLYRIR